MAKPEWGTKRQCLSCGARFYDLGRDPIACPKCETEFKPEDRARSEARRPVARRPETPPPEPTPEPTPEKTVEMAHDADFEIKVDDEQADADGEDEEDAKAESENYIENASELGQDEDDMAEVLEASTADAEKA